MNLIALISAIIGVVFLSIVVGYGNSIKNCWYRYSVALIGVLLAIMLIGYAPAMLGNPSTQTSAKAGEYFAYVIVAVVIIKSLVFRK